MGAYQRNLQTGRATQLHAQVADGSPPGTLLYEMQTLAPTAPVWSSDDADSGTNVHNDHQQLIQCVVTPSHREEIQTQAATQLLAPVGAVSMPIMILILLSSGTMDGNSRMHNHWSMANYSARATARAQKRQGAELMH